MVYAPAAICCTIGFLNVIYQFIISDRFAWNIAAMLTVAISCLGAIVYAVLLLWTYRKIRMIQTALPTSQDQAEEPPSSEELLRWQSPKYYQNYFKNMFPSASYEPTPVPYEESPTVTEEEKQRQQMLMLLLNHESPNDAPSSSGTFRIDWHAQEQDSITPHPFKQAKIPDTAASAYQRSGILTPSAALSRASRQYPGELRPWDGIWRGVAPQQSPVKHGRMLSREDRRRQIEMGA